MICYVSIFQVMKFLGRFIFAYILWQTISISAKSLSKEDAKSYEQILSSLSQMVGVMDKISASFRSRSAAFCDAPIGSLENAFSDWNSEARYSHGDTVTVICKKGYVTQRRLPKQTVRCLLGNTWTKFQPCSEPVCSRNVDIPENSFTNWSPENIYILNDTVTISCKGRYETESKKKDQIVTCLPGNQWSTSGQCEIVECPPGFVNITNSCILISGSRPMLNWQEAVDKCEDLDSHLVMPKSFSLFEGIKDILKTIGHKKQFWIAGSDLATEGQWLWIDGTDMPPDGPPYWGITDWGTIQPNGGRGENCAVMDGEDKFTIHDYPCDRQMQFICQQGKLT